MEQRWEQTAELCMVVTRFLAAVPMDDGPVSPGPLLLGDMGAWMVALSG